MPTATPPIIPRLQAVTLALCVLLIVLPAQANPYLEDMDPGSKRFNFDESQVTPWIERETEIPDLPDPETLQPLVVSGLPPGFKLFLDTGRITVNPDDGVVRLWVFLRSEQGAENGTYEGYRCITGEYKIYGYATPQRDPAVTPAKRSAWRKVPGKLFSTNYRRLLLSHYLCGFAGPRPPTEIHEAVRSGELRDPMLYR